MEWELILEVTLLASHRMFYKHYTFFEWAVITTVVTKLFAKTTILFAVLIHVLSAWTNNLSFGYKIQSKYERDTSYKLCKICMLVWFQILEYTHARSRDESLVSIVFNPSIG